MKSHIMKNDCKRVVKDSHESYWLEPIKPTDSVMIRIMKLWAENMVETNEKMRILGYNGPVKVYKQEGAHKI